MKTFKHVLLTLFLAFISMVMISCPGAAGPEPSSEQGSGSNTGSTNVTASGGELKSTLWFFEDMEMETQRPSENGSENGQSGEEGEDGGNGNGNGGSTTTKNVRTYIHFINEIDCVYGSVDLSGDKPAWTPKFAGTYTAKDSSLTFTFSYKAFEYSGIENNLAVWGNTGYDYSYGYSPSDLGLKKADSLTYSANASAFKTFFSYIDGGYPAKNTYIWSKQNYTDAAIDGLLLDATAMKAFEGKTFINNNTFTTFAASKKVYTGSLYANPDNTYSYKDYDKNMKTIFNERTFKSETNEYDSEKFWSYCGGYVVITQKSVDEGQGQILSVGKYEAADLEGGSKIYATAKEKKITIPTSYATVDLIPEAKAYPSILTTDSDNSTAWDSSKDWCYQNATFYSEYDATAPVPHPEVKLEFSIEYKEPCYSIVVYNKDTGNSSETRIDTTKILPNRIFNSNGNAYDVTVVNKENGTIKLTSGETSYTLKFYCRPTYCAEIANNNALKITNFYVEAKSYPKDLDEDSVAEIDDEAGTITFHVKNRNSIESFYVKYETNAYGSRVSMNNEIKNGDKIELSFGDFKREYTFVLDNTVKKISLNANNIEWDDEIDDVTFSPYFGLKELPEIEIAGYTFKGWNTKSDGTGTDIASFGKNAYTQDFTLYAKWEANSDSAYATINKNFLYVYGSYVEHKITTTKVTKGPGDALTINDILTENEQKYFVLVTQKDLEDKLQDLIYSTFDSTTNTLPEPSAIPGFIKADNSVVYDAIILPKKISYTIKAADGYVLHLHPDDSTIGKVYIDRHGYNVPVSKQILSFDINLSEETKYAAAWIITAYVNVNEKCKFNDMSLMGIFELCDENHYYVKVLDECIWTPEYFTTDNTDKTLRIDPSMDGKTFVVAPPANN